MVAGVGGADFSAGGIRVAVADEEEAVAGVFEEADAGELVGDGFFGHHAAGEGVDGAGDEGDLAFVAAVSGDEFHVGEEFEAGHFAA